MLEPAPGVEFGRYVVVGRPEYYGAGSLVAAREARSGARRTLWLLMPNVVADPAQRAPLIRAAIVLRKLESAHLLHLHEFGEIDGQPFFATAPLHGVDLLTACAPDGIPPEDALDLVAQVGTGINHLHHAGLVDGALGPQRVLVEQREGKVHASVVHAGLLPVLLAASPLFGSHKQDALDFGAPELHHGDAPTVRSDVYSLGCLLWLAVTGEAPFASYAEHRTAPVPQVEAAGPVAEALNSVLERALAKDPAHRYRDVGAFAATIRAIAALAREDAAGDLPARLVPRTALSPQPVPVAVPVGVPVAVPAPAPAVGSEVAPALPAPLSFAPEASAPRVPASEASAVPVDVEAGPERALVAAVEHWEAGRPVSRARPPRKRRKGVIRTGTVAAVLGTLAVATVWGARHTDFLAELRPEATAAPSKGVAIPTGSASAAPLDPIELLFPLAAAGACRFDTAQVAHRIERWTCQRTGFRVVLTHWDSRESALAFVPHGGDEGAREPWLLDGARAGTQWTWRAAGGERPYRWTAIYRDVPYAVVIEAKDRDRRRYARQHVVIRPSTVLG